MTINPFVVTKVEEFNHSYNELATLMHFKPGLADVLLSNGNVFIEGSRGSGKSMYLRLLSSPVRDIYEQLASQALVEKLPQHRPYLGVYVKLGSTIFSHHEYEEVPGFAAAFQYLFNTYCAESLLRTLADSCNRGMLQLDPSEEQLFCQRFQEIALKSRDNFETLDELTAALATERQLARLALDTDSYTTDERAQSDALWNIASAIGSLQPMREWRVHFLIDEYDSLCPELQHLINSYLRKRDFPVTFKIACKKHMLTLEDSHGRPLNSSDDFDRVELDDDEFGLTGTSRDYLEAIANKRLANAGLEFDIKALLGLQQPRNTGGVERRYGGYRQVTMLSSGIVRTFLELCRDIYAQVMDASDSRSPPISLSVQDRVIKSHASSKWNALARNQSARPELQHLIEQIALVFREKSSAGAERQIIRLEVVDPAQLSSFMRALLDGALEYEALILPNKSRIQKNLPTTSQGYVLNRLLCVHFRLEPKSRWDFEISAEQLQSIALGTSEDAVAIVKKPTKAIRRKRTKGPSTPSMLDPNCPLLDKPCPMQAPVAGLGFLSCRLPDAGKIRDAIGLIKKHFASNSDRAGVKYEIKIAEDYPPTGDIACKVCLAFANSEFVLCELSRTSPSVSMELGLAIARRVPLFILFNDEETKKVSQPFASHEYISYPITEAGVESMVRDRIIPYLRPPEPQIRIGPDKATPLEESSGVFVALADTPYYQQTVLPRISEFVESLGLGPVKTEHEGRSLNDLNRAALAIASSKFCLIDTTLVAPTRCLYLGMAQGYRKPFANLIDVEKDATPAAFANAGAMSEISYRDTNELLKNLAIYFKDRFGFEAQ